MKTLHFLATCARFAVLSILISLITALGLLQTERGQAWAFPHLIHYIEDKTGMQIRVGKANYLFPLRFRLEQVSLSQNDRPMLSIENLECRWTFAKLLQGNVTLSNLEAFNVHIHRLLTSPSSSDNLIRPWETLLPSFSFTLEHIDIQHIQLEQAAIDALNLPPEIRHTAEDSLLDIQGRVSHLPSQEPISAHLLLFLHPRSTDLPPCRLKIDAQNHQIVLAFDCQEFPLNTLAPNLPSTIHGRLALQASAPIETWQNTIQGASQQGTDVEGLVTLSLAGSEVFPLPHSLILNDQTLPLIVEGSFKWSQGRHFILDQLKARTAQTHLEGKIACYAPDYIWEGEVEAQTEDLRDLFYFWPTPINGKGKLQLQLTTLSDPTHHQKHQGFHVELAGQQLNWRSWQAGHLILDVHTRSFQEEEQQLYLDSYLEVQDLRGKECSIEYLTLYTDHQVDLVRQTLSHISGEWAAKKIESSQGTVAQATGKASLSDPLQGIEGTIEMALHDIHTPTVHLETLEGASSLDPAQNRWPFRIRAEGGIVWNRPFSFATEGSWHFQSEIFELQAERLTGLFGPYPLQLIEPLHMLKEPRGMQLSALHVQWGGAEIEAECRLDHQLLSAAFKTNEIPSELIHFIASDIPFTGLTTLYGRLEGSLKSPKGQFHIDLNNIQITEDIFPHKPVMAGKLDLDLEEEGIRIKGEWTGVGAAPLALSGTFPVSISFDPLSWRKDATLPLALTLTGEGDLNPYLHLFYHEIANVSGQTKIALALGGDMNAPQLHGSIDLSNGAYESVSTGAIFHSIQAHLEGDGSKIILTQFSALDNKQGVITATGSLSLDADRHFPFDIRIDSSRLFILDSDYATISASGPLSLIGNMEHSKLQGNLSVDQAIVHLEQTLPRQIRTLDVTYINLPEGTIHLVEKKDKNSSLELEVHLHASETIFIQDSHLKSQWKGNIAIEGTPDHPQLHGDLHLSEGAYDFNGKAFNLIQGNIHFAGPPDKKTTLYVVASKDIDRIRAEIIVKGPVNKPVISFHSNPPLSQREVLSYILFNRGISDITADQGDQLSHSFISLNSTTQTKPGSDFLSRLRNNMGIDRLDFTTNDQENQDFGLQVGKNITENVSVSVNQSMTSATPIIAVEAKLRKNLKAQAEAGVNADAPVRMSLKWKKDY